MDNGLQMIVLIAAVAALIIPSALSLMKYFLRARRPDSYHRLIIRVDDEEFVFDANSFDDADARRFERATEAVKHLDAA